MHSSYTMDLGTRRYRTHHVVARFMLVLGACCVFGCAGKAANSAPAASATSVPAADDDAMAGLLEHHRYHHHGGVTLFIAMSLDTLGVSPEQRVAVENPNGFGRGNAARGRRRSKPHVHARGRAQQLEP